MATAKSVRSPSPTGSVRSTTHAPGSSGSGFGSLSSGGGGKDEVKVDYFTGKHEHLNAFLIQLKLVFKLNPSKYATGPSKVIFAAMHLKGNAFKWFEPTMKNYVDSDTPDKDTMACFGHFAEFEVRLKRVYGAMDEQRSAAREIYNIRQRTSAANYYAEFDQVASKLGWADDEAFAEIFYNGLKDSVKEHMMDPPKDYKDMVDEAIKIDSRLFELRMERHPRTPFKGMGYQRPQGYHFKERTNYRRQDYGDRMDLDVMHDDRASRPYGKRASQTSQREKDKRRKENLCYSCGKPGHRAKECKTAQGLHMMSDGITGMEETKADTSMKTLRITDNQGTTAQKDHQGSDAQGAGESGDNEKLHVALSTYEATSMVYGFGSPEAQDLAYEEACQGKIPPPKEKTKEPIDYSAGFNYLDATVKHASLSWTACYDDSCTIHYSDKMGAGWFPQGPKRKNRRSKKSKELQEALAQEGDMHDQPGFWMMTDGRPEPLPETPEDTKFIAISMTREKLVIVSPYWRTIPCWKTPCQWSFSHQHRIFDPETTKQSPCMIEIAICQDKDCPIEDTHAHQGYDEKDVVPIEIPMKVATQLADLTPPEHLSMMNQGDPDDTELPLSPQDDPNEGATFVFNIHTQGCTLATTQWVKWVCQGECGIETQHAHLYYDQETPPKETVRRIKLKFCQDDTCEEKESLHCHQKGIFETIDIQVTSAKERAIRADWGKDELRMMIDNIATLEPVLDERYDREMIGEKFWCANQECPQYHMVHSHLFNVDPNFPHFPIQTAACEEMIADGMMCEQQECQWRKNLHVHFSQNTFSMMVGEKYNPEIIENVIDHRVDNDYMAEYFGCDHHCTKKGLHKHLYHIDPWNPKTALTAKDFTKSDRCTDEDCAWNMYDHVHLSKN